MMNIFLKKAALTWFLFIPLAVINGTVRELLYKPHIGELLAHQISTFLASIAVIAVAYFLLVKEIENISDKTLLIIGFLWVSLTVGFEFSFGYYVEHLSVSKMIADYNLLNGRVWILFLIIVFLTPLTVKALHKVL